MSAMEFLVPPRYLPFSDGRYTVTARLRPLGALPHFQVDAGYLAYVGAKTEAQLKYKALDDWRETLLAYLDARAGSAGEG